MIAKPNRSDVHDAAAALMKKKGTPALMKVLGTYGAVRTGQIQVRDWERFIADCLKAGAA
jgi:hypothetical protein